MVSDELPDIPDQFLYNRQGPWPQPSPSHPLICADEVLNIPPLEQLLFANTIGQRYLMDQVGYPPVAAAYVRENLNWRGPTTARFEEMMYDTLFTRFTKPLSTVDQGRCKDAGVTYGSSTRKYDFTAMNLLQPLNKMYVAPTVVIFERDASTGKRTTSAIFVNNLYVDPKQPPPWICVRPAIGAKREDPAWPLAMMYALQGASYHVLFVVHPALHFPMDSVNAITKTSVPISHPLFQVLFPHTSYQLALDNGVLESANSVVNDNAQGTRFDPLTANAYNLKVLFGAGYTGLSEKMGYDPKAYPAYDYLKPPMDFESAYGRWLTDYYPPFATFCGKVAPTLLRSPYDAYVKRWASYASAHVLGFPDESRMTATTLANTMAIFMWNNSVVHGGDHYSFALDVSPVEKCLRLRRKPPTSPTDGLSATDVIFTPDDLARAAICQRMFFQPWAIAPNLDQTMYALTEPVLGKAADAFHTELRAVADKWSQSSGTAVMPLRVAAGSGQDYAVTIPQSIQY
jgi:hypothetical protein